MIFYIIKDIIKIYYDMFVDKKKINIKININIEN